MRGRWLSFILFLLLTFACWSSCQDDEDDEEETVDESVEIVLRVEADEIFGFVPDAQIGTVKFSDAKGLVGTRIYGALHLEDLERFLDIELTGTLALVNTNAIKEDDYSIEFTVNEQDTEFEFYIPQIRTVPSILNFELRLTYEEEDLAGHLDAFEADLVYQFNVYRGTPAT